MRKQSESNRFEEVGMISRSELKLIPPDLPPDQPPVLIYRDSDNGNISFVEYLHINWSLPLDPQLYK